MKMTAFWVGVLLVSLSACSTSSEHHDRRAPLPQPDPPETVIVYYYVKAGQDQALEDSLAQAWALYQKHNMVTLQPHLIVKELERPEVGGQSRYIELFTWLNHTKPQHPPAEVTNLWMQMQSLCAPHSGLQGPYGGEVELVNPTLHTNK